MVITPLRQDEPCGRITDSEKAKGGRTRAGAAADNDSPWPRGSSAESNHEEAWDERSMSHDVTRSWGRRGGINLPARGRASLDRKTSRRLPKTQMPPTRRWVWKSPYNLSGAAPFFCETSCSLRAVPAVELGRSGDSA